MSSFYGEVDYLAVTRLDLAYYVHILSQFMEATRIVHWEATLRVVRYLKKNPGRESLCRSDSDLCLEGCVILFRLVALLLEDL